MKQHLYMMSEPSEDLTKIGVSKNPQKRRATIRSESGPVELIYRTNRAFDSALQLERVLHKQLADQRIQGEWFNLSVRDRATVARVADSFSEADMSVQLFNRVFTDNVMDVLTKHNLQGRSK